MGALFSALFGVHTTQPPVTVTPVSTTTPVPTAAPFTPIVTAAAPTAWAPTNPVWQSLQAQGICLTNGGNMATCANGAAQNWYLDPTGMLVNQADGTCLTVAGVTNSTKLTNVPCAVGNVNQQWTSPAAGRLVLANNTNLSLDVPGGYATPGQPASTWFVNNLPPQNWIFK